MKALRRLQVAIRDFLIDTFAVSETESLPSDRRSPQLPTRAADLEELRELVNDWIERPPTDRLSLTLQELFDNAVRPLLRRTER